MKPVEHVYRSSVAVATLAADAAQPSSRGNAAYTARAGWLDLHPMSVSKVRAASRFVGTLPHTCTISIRTQRLANRLHLIRIPHSLSRARCSAAITPFSERVAAHSMLRLRVIRSGARLHNLGCI
jgi:hypothetical protein